MAVSPEDLGVNENVFGDQSRRAIIEKNGPARVAFTTAGQTTLLQWCPLTYDATNDEYIEWIDGAVLDSFVAYGDIVLPAAATDWVIQAIPVRFDIEFAQFVVNGTTQTSAALATACEVLNEKYSGRIVRGVAGGSVA